MIDALSEMKFLTLLNLRPDMWLVCLVEIGVGLSSRRYIFGSGLL